MSARKVSIYLYVKLSSGWRYCPACFYSNGTIKPHVCKTPEGEKKFPGAMYIASVNRKWETLSNDPAEAVRLAEERQGKLLVAAANPHCNEPVTLAIAFERWLQDVKDSGADSSTVDAKTRIAEQFQVHCSDITMLSELTRSHCLTWINTSLVERGNGGETFSPIREETVIEVSDDLHGVTPHKNSQFYVAENQEDIWWSVTQ